MNQFHFGNIAKLHVHSHAIVSLSTYLLSQRNIKSLHQTYLNIWLAQDDRLKLQRCEWKLCVNIPTKGAVGLKGTNLNITPLFSSSYFLLLKQQLLNFYTIFLIDLKGINLSTIQIFENFSIQIFIELNNLD